MKQSLHDNGTTALAGLSGQHFDRMHRGQRRRDARDGLRWLLVLGIPLAFLLGIVASSLTAADYHQLAVSVVAR